MSSRYSPNAARIRSSSSYVRQPNTGVVRAIPGCSWRSRFEFQDLLQAAGLWIFVRRSGLAGLSNKRCLTPMRETVPLSTLQGNCFPSLFFSPYAFQTLSTAIQDTCRLVAHVPALKVLSQSAQSALLRR